MHEYSSTTHHSVEIAKLPVDESESFYFEDRAEAVAFAEEHKSGQRAVWLWEEGKYDSGRGRRIQRWIAYWWNQHGADEQGWVFPPPGRFTGYPETALQTMVEYTAVE